MHDRHSTSSVPRSRRALARMLIWFAAVLLGTGMQLNVALAGPIEEFSQGLLHPTEPNALFLRYQYGGNGLFYSADRGQSWKMMCASMIAPGERADGPMTVTSDGTLLLGVFEGMWEGKDGGCSWRRVPEFMAIRITDVTLHPTDPSIAFAVSGAGSQANGVYRRDATGAWSPVGTPDSGLIIGRVRVAARPEGLRIYMSALRGTSTVGDAGMMVPNYVIRVSDDLGTTWREFPVAVTSGSVRLEAVDPTQPDRIVVSVDEANRPDKVLVSANQGETFSEFLSVTDLGGLALAPDGRIWIGDFGDPAMLASPKGLWAAPNLDTAPAQLTTGKNVECVNYQAATDTLYMCERWSFGPVDQKTGEMTEQLSFTSARDFISCPGMDAPAMCKAQLCAAYCGPTHFASAPLCSAYSDPLCGPTADGPVAPSATAGAGGSAVGSGSGGSGSVGMGASSMASNSPPPLPSQSGGGGCSVLAPIGRSGCWPLAPLALLAGGLIARRRNSRRRCG